jgi:excisionase family DNA binding protein
MVTKGTTQIRNGNRDQTGRMLRTGEACRILCIHCNTLRRWSERRIINAYRVGPRGDRRFRLEDVNALLTEKTSDMGSCRKKVMAALEEYDAKKK